MKVEAFLGITQSSAHAGLPARSGAAPRRFSAFAGLGVALSFLLVGFAGCGGIGDENYVPNLGTPINQADLNASPYCVGTCEPDYGSTRVDCRADDGLEFFPADVLNGDSGAVTGFYSYNDNTAEFLHSGPGGYSTTQGNFEPPTVTVTDLCGEADDTRVGTNRVHHLRGGLFREWGGGMGRRLVNFVTEAPLTCLPGPSRPTDPEYCPDADPRVEDAIAAGASEMLRGQFYGMMADLRGWEGISFWARQGPNNTAGIRVYVGDRQLDEDIAFLETNAGITPLCGRVRECGCRNHRPCTPAGGGLVDSHCFDPNEIPNFPELRAEYADRNELTLFEERFPLCGASECNDPNDAFTMVDPSFSTPAAVPPGTAECQVYKLTNDLEDYFCFDRNKPETYPPDGPERCGDGWAKGVTLTNDWKFYKVPFTELRQEGYGKEFQYLDLSKITLVRFTWMQGWVDVWLDDVRFYRQASAAPASE
jgi:hypothetical protein